MGFYGNQLEIKGIRWNTCGNHRQFFNSTLNISPSACFVLADHTGQTAVIL
jgi:hypothetical protein